MSNLLFKPWIGKEYGKSNLGRLLIIGESHYDFNTRDDYSNFTIDILTKLGSQNGAGDNNFFKKIGKLFNADDYLEVWEKVAFANGIQHIYKESRQQKTPTEIETIAPAVLEYLRITKPEKVLFCSSLIFYRGLPDKYEWIKYITTLKNEIYPKDGVIDRFSYEGGTCIGMGIDHPSSRNPHFKTTEWKPLVNEFLSLPLDYEG